MEPADIIDAIRGAPRPRRPNRMKNEYHWAQSAAHRFDIARQSVDGQLVLDVDKLFSDLVTIQLKAYRRGVADTLARQPCGPNCSRKAGHRGPHSPEVKP